MDRGHEDRVKEIIKEETSPLTPKPGTAVGGPVQVPPAPAPLAPAAAAPSGADPTRISNFDPASLRPRPNTSLGLVFSSTAGGAASHPAAQSSAGGPAGAPATAAAPGGAADGLIDPNELPADDVRLQPGYAEWYYAQNPRDPRYPAPLVSYSRFQARGSTPPPPTMQIGGGQAHPQHGQHVLGGQQGFDLSQGGGGVPGLSPEQLSMAAYTAAAYAASGYSPQQQQQLMAAQQVAAAAAYHQRAQHDPLSAIAFSQLNPVVAAAAIAQSNPILTMHLAAQLAMYGPTAAAMQQSSFPQVQQAQQMFATNASVQQQQQNNQLMAFALANAGLGLAPGVGFPPQGAYTAGAGHPLQSYAQQQERLELERMAQLGFGGPHVLGNPALMGQLGGALGGPRRGGRGGRGGFDDQDGGRGRGGRGGRGAFGGMGGPMGGPSGMNAASSAAAPRVRSPFLDEFRVNAATWALGNIIGHVDELARDQEGSRFIQRQLEAPGTESTSIDALFEEVSKEPLGLMTDVFGNYVVQKMLDVGNPGQIHILAESITGHVVELTLQTYGCRVIQRAIHVLSPADRIKLFEELRENISLCVQDQNGNHVIQKCIEEMPTAGDYIVQSFLGRVPEYATHAYGCRVIQCILANCPQHEADILPEILAHLDLLTTDQFGNYVVQHLIADCRHPRFVEDLVEQLEPKFYIYSVHKFASNVMEKMYLKVDEQHKAALLEMLIVNMAKDHPDSPVSQLVAIMCDQFGNYVMQRILEHASEDQKKAMVEHVKSYVHIMRRYTYGKHILARLERASSTSLGGTSPDRPHGGERGGGGHRGGRGGGRGGDRGGYGAPYGGGPHRGFR